MSAPNSTVRRKTETAAILQHAIALHRGRTKRDKCGLLFIEGVRNFIRAVDNGIEIERLLFSDKLLINPIARMLVRRCRRAGVQATSLTPEEFRRISQTKRASGVSAIVRQNWADLNAVSPDNGICWTVLETVQSAGNFGTLIRSSNAVGGSGFILVGRQVDPYSPAVVRAAMGAVFEQKFVRTNLDALRAWVDRTSCPVIGAAPEAKAELHHFAFSTRPPLLVLGEERKGLSQAQRDLCDDVVRIPMQEGTDSLNLGVAGSLLMYEVHRNRAILTSA